jgi:hypothetical protein
MTISELTTLEFLDACAFEPRTMILIHVCGQGKDLNVKKKGTQRDNQKCVFFY